MPAIATAPRSTATNETEMSPAAPEITEASVRRELFGTVGVASGAKSTKKSDRSGGLELFGLDDDVGGANDANDMTAVAGVTDLSSAAPHDRGSVAAVDTACFQSQHARHAPPVNPQMVRSATNLLATARSSPYQSMREDLRASGQQLRRLYDARRVLFPL
jgi:hypothetical protein